MLNILVTNDDGVHAPGIEALRRSLTPIAKVTVVAPDRERSGVGHGLTLTHPLRLREVSDGVFSLDGTPTDCVLASLEGLFEEPFDLCVSGINHGPNMGHDVHYSGTFAGAAEAGLRGMRGIAVSLAAFQDHDFSLADVWLPRLVETVTRHPWPAETVLNVNLPNLPASEVRGMRLTRLGHRVYRDQLHHREDPRGSQYFWIGGSEPDWTAADGTDFSAVHEGFVSVTPVNLDMTHVEALETLSGWGFDEAT